MIGDNFMWIPDSVGVDIDGETSDSFFSKLSAFEVGDFSFTMTNEQPTSSGDGSVSQAGKAKFQEFTVEKLMDSSSVPLYKACSQGTMIPSMMLGVRKASGTGGLLYVQYIFRCNYVTGITWSGGAGSGAKEKMTFSFKALGVQYIAQKPDGSEGKKQAWSWNTAAQSGARAGAPGLEMGDPNFPKAPAFISGSR
jgi:type VI secretion system secreted protein Hcp